MKTAVHVSEYSALLSFACEWVAILLKSRETVLISCVDKAELEIDHCLVS